MTEPSGMLARSRKRWKSDTAALVALAALVLAFFWKIALTNRVLAGLDVLAFFYPYRDFASEALRAGRLPLWNPYLFMGAPLLANSQTAVLYPLHWPLIWLSAPKQIAWSIVLHTWLGAAGTYLFARHVPRLRPPAAFAAAAVFALGGFLGAQVEHVNQLNTSAWLPWLLLCVETAMSRERGKWLALPGGGAVVGLVLLAGHTQAAYIVVFCAGLYALMRGLRSWKGRKGLKRLAGLHGVGALAGMSTIGTLLAAGQLLPTLELARLSVRSGGLPYDEAASFSLKPGLVLKAFLPPFVWDPPFSEYVAYVGLVGLVLAGLGTWATLKRKQAGDMGVQDRSLSHGSAALVLALTGIFLAFGAYNPAYYLLYKLVPGFNLFRAPARWLLLYGFGTAVLVGIGLETVYGLTLGRASRRRPLWGLGAILLLVIELYAAARQLAYNHPTAPAAFNSMRTAPAHLLADESGQPFRFLSLSDIRYDPGDLGDLQARYGSQLPEREVYDLVVAAKMKEVLAFNLPLGDRLFSVDGYDGGLLPIADYVTLERLFLEEEEIWPDGRLRQQLSRVPSARLLSLLNVKYVITDKVQDAWIDDVFYDLEHTVTLGHVELTDLPALESTHLGVVSYLSGTTDLVDGTPVARVTITDADGGVVTMTLLAGEHTAEGRYEAAPVAHGQAPVGHYWPDGEQGTDYHAMLGLGRALLPQAIVVHSLLPEGQVHLRGLTLIDDRSGTSRNLSVHPAYRLVHSGDVKMYQNLTVLPRAFVVHQAAVVADSGVALSAMRRPTFDPARRVILDRSNDLESAGQTSGVEIVAYEPERVELRVALDAPGYLVLTDAFYPGWMAEVDGLAAPIQRADLYFRAVALKAGEHNVTFHFRPLSVRLGLGVSLASWLTWGLALAMMAGRIGLRASSGV
jgi:hypothetical protein